MRVASAGLVAGIVLFTLVLVVRQLAKGGGSVREWHSPEHVSVWAAPVLGAVAFANFGLMPDAATRQLGGALLGGLAFGAIAALLSLGPIRVIRDFLLSAAGVYATFLMVRSYLDENPSGPAALAYSPLDPVPLGVLVLLLCCFGLGVLFNALRTFRLPQLGLSAFGAIEIMIFLASPSSGMQLIEDQPVSVFLILCAIAVIIGFAAAGAPNIIIPLATIAIATAQFGINVVLAFGAAADGRAANVDWSGTALIGGTILGFSIVFAIARALSNPAELVAH